MAVIAESDLKTSWELSELYPVDGASKHFRVWEKLLQKWRETGKLEYGKHYVQGIVGSHRAYKYYEPAVVSLIIKDQENSVCLRIYSRNADAIEEYIDAFKQRSKASLPTATD